jgi:Xaa-Pro aminopeptidase
MRMVMGVCAASVLLAAGLLAQPVFRGTEIFPPEEFAARRARMIEQIGDGVAIVLGTTEPPGEMPFRQNNQFFYLTGVTEPRASVIIDARAKTTTVFLQPTTAMQDNSQYGPGMVLSGTLPIAVAEIEKAMKR